jgi:hypothetical protein
MRRDDHPVDLLIGDVGKRKHGPVARVLRRTGAHLDAPDDAVGAGCGRNLKGFAAADYRFPLSQ